MGRNELRDRDGERERETSKGERGVERKETWTERDEDGEKQMQKQRNRRKSFLKRERK